MQHHPSFSHPINIEEHIVKLLRHYGASEEEINLSDLKKVSGQLVKSLWESYRKISAKSQELTPLLVERARGGIVFRLEGAEKAVPFHGAQDKALYLFFRKHSGENLTSQKFLRAKETDPRIRRSLLDIYKAIRGNKQEKEYLALIDKINEAGLSQTISRVNSAFRKVVTPSLLDQYTISAGSNEPRKVLLPADYLLVRDQAMEKALGLRP